MKKTAFLLDILFTFLSGGLACLCFFRYLSVTLWLAILLSVLCGLLAAFAVGAIMHLRRKTTFLKSSDERIKQKLLLHLALLSDKEKTEFFKGVLNCRSPSKSSALRLYDEENLYFLKFKLSPVTADEVAALSRLKTNKQRVLLCAEIEDGAKTLCQRLQIQVQTGDAVYQRLKEQDALPQEYLGGEDQDGKRSRRKILYFSKSNAKRFLVSGALVLALSFLTPFPYYYLLFGGILLLAALLVRIFGYA